MAGRKGTGRKTEGPIRLLLFPTKDVPGRMLSTVWRFPVAELVEKNVTKLSQS